MIIRVGPLLAGSAVRVVSISDGVRDPNRVNECWPFVDDLAGAPGLRVDKGTVDVRMPGRCQDRHGCCFR